MKNRDYKASAISLGVGNFLMIVTMVLHPVGGDIAGLQQVSSMAIISHAIAICSLPFTYLGFKGLTQYLKGHWFFAEAGFSFFLFASIAVLSAGTVNGLVVPFFVEGLDTTANPSTDMAYMVLRYSFSLNKAYDLIFMCFTCLAVLSWSLAILRMKLLNQLLGWFGVALGLVGLFLVLFGGVLTHLHDFRLFIFGYVLWAILAGVALYRSALTQKG